MLAAWAQDLAALAVVLGATVWLLARWLWRQPARACSGCPPRQARRVAGIRPKRLTVLR